MTYTEFFKQPLGNSVSFSASKLSVSFLIFSLKIVKLIYSEACKFLSNCVLPPSSHLKPKTQYMV